MKLASVVRLVLLTILVLLAILQKPDTIAFTQLANDEFQLLAEFDLDLTELIPGSLGR